MAITHLFRVVFNGAMTAGPEIFSYGCWVGATSGSPTTADVASDASDAVSAFLATASSGVSGITVVAGLFNEEIEWQSVGAREYNLTTGAAEGDGFTVLPLTEQAGTGSAPSMPYQDALAVTFDRGGLGRERWNRFYLPPFASIGALLTDGGILHTGVTGSILDGVTAMFNAFAEGSSNAGIIHWSPKGKVATQFPLIKVGNVIDTQRRRRNALTELYATFQPS